MSRELEWREVVEACAGVVSSSELECLEQLVTKHHVPDELHSLVTHFATERRASRRLCVLRELAVRLGDVQQLCHLLSSAHQRDMDQLLTDTLHWAPAAKRLEILRVLLNQSDTKYAASADPDSRHNGKTAFHVATEHGFHELLLVLQPKDCNAVTSLGETALHCLVRETKQLRFCPSDQDTQTHVHNLMTSMRVLVEDLHLDINVRDHGGYTAVHLASIRQVWDIVTYLVHKKANVDIFTEGQSARDIIELEHPDISINYPIDTHEPLNVTKYLFSLITSKKEEKLIQEIERLKVNVNLNNGEFTLLQAVVKHGLAKVAKMLLTLGADINTRCGDLNTPVMLAVNKCDESILEILLQYKTLDLSLVNSNMEMCSVLHLAVMKARTDCQCVKLLCEYQLNDSIDINQSDYRGKTALHYAVQNRQDNNIVYLLRNKASIFILSDEDVPAFAGVDLEYLRGFLDDQIVIEGSAFNKNSTYNLTADFQFLVTPTEKLSENKVISGNDAENGCLITVVDNNNSPDMRSLLLLANSKIYKPLLNHPLIRSFIHLKWHRFFWLFYINFVMLAIFTSSFSVYIYYLVNDVNLKYGQNNNATAALTDTEHKEVRVFSQYLAAFTLMFLISREMFQIYISVTFWHYISYIVNLVEIALILISGFLLFVVPYDYHAIHTLSAIAILLAFAELVILIGSHPVLTIYYTMLFRVGRDFLYFLLWYSLLVVAFGISFYILFQHCEDDCSGNLFGTIWTAIFKTTVMLQGEFDANNLKFDSFTIISHVIFLFFFFSMVIVLMNLLNGLAVSDIQIIKNESDIICMESQVKLYAKFENIIFNIINKRFKYMGTILINHSVLLTGLLKENKIQFTLTKAKTLAPDVRNSCNRRCFDCNSGTMCGINMNCIKSKHFKKMFPLCFEFENIVEEMVNVYKERSHFIRSFDAQVEDDRMRSKSESDEQNALSDMIVKQDLLMEQQNKLEQTMATMNCKIDAMLNVFQAKYGLELKF